LLVVVQSRDRHLRGLRKVSSFTREERGIFSEDAKLFRQLDDFVHEFLDPGIRASSRRRAVRAEIANRVRERRDPAAGPKARNESVLRRGLVEGEGELEAAILAEEISFELEVERIVARVLAEQ